MSRQHRDASGSCEARVPRSLLGHLLEVILEHPDLSVAIDDGPGLVRHEDVRRDHYAVGNRERALVETARLMQVRARKTKLRHRRGRVLLVVVHVYGYQFHAL